MTRRPRRCACDAIRRARQPGEQNRPPGPTHRAALRLRHAQERVHVTAAAASPPAAAAHRCSCHAQAAFKEGGKKGVDLQVRAVVAAAAAWHEGEGACQPIGAVMLLLLLLRSHSQGVNAMGGVVFFNLAVETPDGDMELLEYVMEGANVPVDEAAEERKGGAGGLAKASWCIVLVPPPPLLLLLLGGGGAWWWWWHHRVVAAATERRREQESKCSRCSPDTCSPPRRLGCRPSCLRAPTSWPSSSTCPRRWRRRRASRSRSGQRRCWRR